jgi:DNA repair ATPase RecN
MTDEFKAKRDEAAGSFIPSFRNGTGEVTGQAFRAGADFGYAEGYKRSEQEFSQLKATPRYREAITDISNLEKEREQHSAEIEHLKESLDTLDSFCGHCRERIKEHSQLRKQISDSRLYAQDLAEQVKALEAELDNKRGAMTLEIHRVHKEREDMAEKLKESIAREMYWHDKWQTALNGTDLKIAIEALKYYAEIHHMVGNYNMVAHEALAKIKGENNG